jgi:tRNA modification GTPase
MISISAKEQTGMDDLEETIKEVFFSGEVTFNDEVYITNIRHKTALQEAMNSLNLVVQSIMDGMPEDFYSIDLMNAYEELGSYHYYGGTALEFRP